jgi:hypothetical protein
MRVLMLLSALSLTIAGAATAAPCRDAHGRFMRCPTMHAAPVRCRDTRGRFAKCGMPGVHPA